MQTYGLHIQNWMEQSILERLEGRITWEGLSGPLSLSGSDTRVSAGVPEMHSLWGFKAKDKPLLLLCEGGGVSMLCPTSTVGTHFSGQLISKYNSQGNSLSCNSIQTTLNTSPFLCAESEKEKKMGKEIRKGSLQHFLFY